MTTENDASKLSPHLLNEMYKNILSEYRFQVQYNWDRTKYYLTLVTSVTGFSITIYATHFSSFPLFKVLAFCSFAIGIYLSQLAKNNLLKGKEYYRQIVVQKTALEQALGIVRGGDGIYVSEGILTTGGMQNIEDILNNPQKYIKSGVNKGTATSFLVRLMHIFTTANIFGGLFVLVDMIGYED